MPRTPEQYEEIRNEKKQIILDAALELFAETGYHATSISKIAEKANISKGLMYNYFSSKEELLKVIILQFSDEMNEMMNPDHDDVITLEEASQFIDLYFDMLKNRTNSVKLYYQMAMQPEVLRVITKLASDHVDYKTQLLFMDFLKKSGNPAPHETMMALNAILKGFGMQYAFAPEMVPDEVLDSFKEYLKNTFIYKSH